MKIVIAYSHVDAKAALRLLCWLKHLGGVPVPIVLGASRRVSRMPIHQEIVSFARSAFDVAAVIIPHDELEIGWPRSATHMFVRVQEKLAGEAFFWLEPDCVPLRPGWFELLLAEYEASGKTFMGGYLPKAPTHPEHMTGNAFYGVRRLQAAPGLGRLPKTGDLTGAWDVDQAPDILKDFAETRLIHHYWHRNKNYHPKLADVRDGAVLYHQCKTGALMSEIDPMFVRAPLTQRVLSITTANDMPKHYLTENAGRPVEISGRNFTFEAVEYFQPTSSWWGVYQTEDPVEAAILDAAVHSGLIQEINAADYATYLAKKKTAPSSGHIVNLRQRHAPRQGAPSGRAVQVVAEPVRAPAESVADVLLAAPPAKSPPAPKAAGKSRKSS